MNVFQKFADDICTILKSLPKLHDSETTVMRNQKYVKRKSKKIEK